jgi:hypothetical protein
VATLFSKPSDATRVSETQCDQVAPRDHERAGPTLTVAVGPFAEESKCDQNTVTFIGGPLDGPNELYLRSM